METLFHEFGHGLQHMITTVDNGHVSGINGVELGPRSRLSFRWHPLVHPH